ncbi:hypothetical protein AB833_16225 [Chromatiales bacterium (ex Bugula neritina AB1)]|nr:hypothetical protein AB833_16225 [Chromatiales bacterium (ex Bugula neritina AB1)]
MNSENIGKLIFDKIDALAELSENRENLTRVSLSPEHQLANTLVGQWMADAGMQVRVDAVGNVIGRTDGSTEGPALMLGSHLDTVRDGGRYDGMLGVVVPLVCMEILHKRGEKLAYPVEVVGFSDEEGVRFPSTLHGSKAIAGTFDTATLDDRDANGISIAEALTQFGLDPKQLHSARRMPEEFFGFIEIHIEQGPVLEKEQLPVGVVTAIAGASRYRVTVSGKAGHAGTVPMNLRKDALTAASECIVEIEAICNNLADVVGTVGEIRAAPGAGNVIPGEVEISLDLRSSENATRKHAEQLILDMFDAVAAKRGLTITTHCHHEATSVDCDKQLCEQLAAAIEATGYRSLGLPSGAGHDAMAIADLTPMAMLFVRCKDGLSHHPDESMTADDAAVAALVLLKFLTHINNTANSG